MKNIETKKVQFLGIMTIITMSSICLILLQLNYHEFHYYFKLVTTSGKLNVHEGVI